VYSARLEKIIYRTFTDINGNVHGLHLLTLSIRDVNERDSTSIYHAVLNVCTRQSCLWLPKFSVT